MCVGHGLHRKSYVAQDFCAFEKRYVFARKKAHVVKPVEGGFILAGGGLVSPPARCSSKPDNVAHKSGCDRKKRC